MKKYHPEMLGMLKSPYNARLTSEQVFDLQQALGNELCETGLHEDDEPNQRGLELEELIDWVGKQRTT